MRGAWKMRAKIHADSSKKAAARAPRCAQSIREVFSEGEDTAYFYFIKESVRARPQHAHSHTLCRTERRVAAWGGQIEELLERLGVERVGFSEFETIASKARPASRAGPRAAPRRSKLTTTDPAAAAAAGAAAVQAADGAVRRVL